MKNSQLTEQKPFIFQFHQNIKINGNRNTVTTSMDSGFIKFLIDEILKLKNENELIRNEIKALQFTVGKRKGLK